jgi:hypothetical protein
MEQCRDNSLSKLSPAPRVLATLMTGNPKKSKGLKHDDLSLLANRHEAIQ